MSDIIKIASAQINPIIKEKEKNLVKILAVLREAAANQAQLIVYPECALTGYVYNSKEEAGPYMETIPGPITEKVALVCKELGVYCSFGLLEKDGDKCFNVAVLIGPEGLIGKYRKTHLPFLGIDRFMDKGDNQFQVFRTPVGNIGMHICYDVNFPEVCRVMALMGADILVLPTNWPEGRGKVAQYVVVTRAFENKVHFIVADRVGIERGTKFIGMSKIINAWGDTLVEASRDNEEIVYAEVSLSDAREKHVVLKPGEFEYNFIGNRRPELYGKLCKIE
ncbi:MAG: carbon-nitrogen hydrolase family protein [Dehalococcoidales bacterium]|nr:carbon-nitrogen hydrolase family protein [Dehalococcoidales bacterium]